MCLVQQKYYFTLQNHGNVMKRKLFLGIMSGSSLDGIDLCLAQFEGSKYIIQSAKTIQYSAELKEELTQSPKLNAFDINVLDSKLGSWIGGAISDEFDFSEIEGIGYHGHTVFHEPSLGFSLQLGNIDQISSKTNTTVIGNFRNIDIALGGQGAPLVPNIEKILFPQFNQFLNLGGIANISLHGEKPLGIDVCPFNQVTNYFSSLLGKEFDKGGELGKKGKVNQNLLELMNEWSYYSKPPPKSLSNQEVKEFINFIKEKDNPENILCTFYHHSAKIISDICLKNTTLLITGGGAYNKYFIEILSHKHCVKTHLPEAELIEFKEALIFAKLAELRLMKETNTYNKFTGAKSNSTGGQISGLATN
jgi:anhydro-N-acetylmuramic acid kinase